MSRLRVFVTQPVAESALTRLRAVADVEVNPDSSRIIDKAALCAGVARCDILFSLLHDVVDKEVLAANPKLRAVISMVITPDHIDMAEATRRRIPVTNIPAIVTDATADIAFGLLLAVARRIVEGDKLFREGVYPGSQSNHLAGAAVTGKTLGLIGGGRIGQAVARRAQGFGMRVLYADPVRLPAEREQALGMVHAGFDDVLREADFISLHPQLTPQTRHLIGARELGLMKRSAFVINTSRGPVIDEAALTQALTEGRIAGAGLDVYEHEPKVSPALVGMANVVLTPHLGSAVFELREGMAHVVVDNAIAIIEGRRPPNCLNPEVYSA
jgi:glyoxylate reductase